MRIAAVTAVLLSAMVAGPALAQTNVPVPQQLAAKPAKGKDVKASPLSLAQQGDPEAQMRVGLAYLRGTGIRGIKKDPREAVTWLGLAAAWGRPDAAMELARAYERGAGLKKDSVEAARWWFRAGKLGNEAARERFVAMFLAGETDGVGGPEAVEWLSPKATTGDANAILGLASMYEHGKGIPVDVNEAQRWYLKLALAGHAEAQFRLGRLLLALPSLWRVPDDEFKDGKWTGAVWYTAKPDIDTDKYAYLGRPGMIHGERWLTEAARRDHAEAMFLLASAKLAGIDLPFDLTEGVTFMEAAAEHGHAGALVATAQLAAKGQGYHGKDPVRAWVSYDIAAMMGRKDADSARDLLSKTMSARQVARARQLSQDIRETRGM